MRVFLAGATGVIGRRLARQLRLAQHDVTGTTRAAGKTEALRGLGVTPVVVDVLDAEALAHAVAAACPDIVIHQLTDLPSALDLNRRLRIEGTANLMRAAKAAGVRRAVAQSIAFAYAPGERARTEDDPLDTAAAGARLSTVQGIVALERAVLQTADVDGVVLRYGYLYGPDTWYAEAPKPPSVHVDAAAQAALLAVSRGAGIYNIADADGAVSIAKAVRDLDFAPAFRMG